LYINKNQPGKTSVAGEGLLIGGVHSTFTGEQTRPTLLNKNATAGAPVAENFESKRLA